MILNNINFLSFLIIIVFTYLIYEVYQINNTQTENFRRRRGRKKRRGWGILKKIKKNIKVKKVKTFLKKKIANPVSKFFNIKRKLRLERERRERELKLMLDIVRNNYQVNINKLSNNIKKDSIESLSKSSQSVIKGINSSSKIANNIYKKSIKDNIINKYLGFLN